MQIISSLVFGELLKLAEAQLAAHAPEVQAFLLQEFQTNLAAAVAWVEKQIAALPAKV